MLNKEEKEYLEKLLIKLSRAKKSALYSYKICKKIGIKKKYTEDEKDSLKH